MSALRDARFRRLLAAESVSSFGDSAMFLSLAIWAKDLTGSSSSAGLAFALLAAPSLAAPLFGHLVDRLRRMPVLLVTNVATALALLPLLTVHTRHDVWVIYLVALAYGVSYRIQGPALSGLLKDMLPSTDAAGARAAISTVTEGLRVLSPAVGAGIYSAAGGAALALFDVATFAVAVALLLTIRVAESEPESRSGEPFRREVTAGFRHLRVTPLLAQLVGTLSVAVAVLGFMDTVLFAAVDHVGRSPAFTGVLLSLQGGGSVVGGIVAARVNRRLGAARCAGLGIALVVVALALFPPVLLPLLVVGMFLAGVGIPLAFVGLGTAQQLYTPARLQGRVAAAVSLAVSTPQSVFIALGAGIVAAVDFRVPVLVAMVVCACCALVLLVRPAAPPPVVASLADGPHATVHDGSVAGAASVAGDPAVTA